MTRRFLAAALASAVLIAAGCGGHDQSKPQSESKTTTRVEVVEQSGREGGFNPRAIYQREGPGVVTVVSLFGSSGLGSILGGDGGGEGGVGSGFVVSGKGEIVTNAHVVTTGDTPNLRQAREVYVEFADHNRVKARIVGADPDADVALLQVDTVGLTLRPLALGVSSKVQVGTPVAAIGSPFGEPQSLSVGVVSAIDRSISSLTSFQIPGAIQTDAAINPGNSGGPLVDEDGRVIGINQQIKSQSGGGEGVGFAVPIDIAKRSVAQLRRGGHARYAYLGIESVALYPQLVQRFDLPVNEGAWVQGVRAGGPAAKAGVRGGNDRVTFQASDFRTGGDIVTKIGDTAVHDPDDLAAAIAKLDPGSVIAVEVWRDGKRQQLKVRLGERPLVAPEQPG
jgi:S1-C subfamily serine protease